MIIFINPLAAGGTAIKKWKRIEPFMHRHMASAILHLLNGQANTQRTISEALQSGETDFVAAGGDGTVNHVMNMLLTIAPPPHHQHIRFGAIGLGSSNDFHKPFLSARMVENTSCMIDFANANLRDVGEITFEFSGRLMTRYFLINASIGLTAEANYFFNNGDHCLRRLKGLHTPSAILYAALRTILAFRNVEVQICLREGVPFTTSLTNLGVVKNPHFSGDLYYGHAACYDNGKLYVHLSQDMDRLERFRLLRALSNGTFDRLEKASSLISTGLNVQAARPFAVEYDGEVITTRSVQFSLLPKHLKVCQ